MKEFLVNSDFGLGWEFIILGEVVSQRLRLKESKGKLKENKGKLKENTGKIKENLTFLAT